MIIKNWGGIKIIDSINNLSTFIIAGILLNLTPGQDILYILGRSVAQGRKAGIISVFGICTGALFHIAASAFGLSVILMTSSLIFSIIKYIGAIYLKYLGIKMFLNKSEILENTFDSNFNSKKNNYMKIYRRGNLTNLLNPKVALAKGQGLDIPLYESSFFLGREKLIINGDYKMHRWRAHIFSFLSINAYDASVFFEIHEDRVFEVGIRLSI